MIVDRLENTELYRGLAPRWVQALDFLRSSDVMSLALGRHDLDGDRLFALVQEYATRPLAECRWEAHRCYCDIQFVAAGTERIGVNDIGQMRVEQPYDPERDLAFFAGDGDFITLRAGSFAIFAPHDVHRPCIQAGQPEQIRKIVVKAAV